MTKENKDFEIFQQEFKKYQEHFGLMGYRVYFEYEPFDDDFAGISIDSANMAATIRLNSKLPKRQQKESDVKRTARHEAIHLLLGRLNGLARERYVSAAEIYEATEEVTHRLETLLPKLQGEECE